MEKYCQTCGIAITNARNDRELKPRKFCSRKCRRQTTETINKIVASRRASDNYTISEKTLLKLRLAKLGKPRSGDPAKWKHKEETKKHLRETSKKAYLEGRLPQCFRAGKKYGPLSQETKRKLREALFKRVEKIGPICPAKGKNETRILNKLEYMLDYKILRQYKVAGYYLDGYIPELKLALEVDEIPKDTPREIERQGIIEKELGCTFMRIKDYVA